MSAKSIVLLEGDGIGPEVCREVVKIVNLIRSQFPEGIELKYAFLGGSAYDTYGTPLPEETIRACKNADSIFLGAVGGPQWDRLPADKRPEKGLLGIRKELNLFTNLRPAKVYGDMYQASSLKETVLQDVDLMIIRELTSGIYFGYPRGIEVSHGQKSAINTMFYNEKEIRRIVKVAFNIADKRNRKLCSVDKANVLEVSQLWREIVNEEAKKYPHISIEHLYVDNAIMQMIKQPASFDTIVTGNLFGDILSDAAAMISGSIGLLPSACIGEKYSLYEPVHGSAPDIAGQDKANPLAAILSLGMMCSYSLQNTQLGKLIECAVTDVLQKFRTPDIMEKGKKLVGCQEMGDMVVQSLEQLLNELE